MLSFCRAAAVFLVLAATCRMALAQSVVAHFIVGNAQHFQLSDWAHNIQLAMDAGIDGFALNVVNDGCINSAVPLAYQAAEKTNGKFKMFLQFDYSQGIWGGAALSAAISKQAASPAQLKVQGKPLVSTFEGVAQAGDWPAVQATTGCHFAPDWTSKKGAGASFFRLADGALSWDVWPQGAHDNNMTDVDAEWRTVLGAGKTYIMGISPWFYTSLPQYGKNWIARGAGLWHARWTAAIRQRPPVVMIITWNDFGESHYIGPSNDTECFPQGSAGYVQHNSHEGWRATLPAYIQAYKSANVTGSSGQKTPGGLQELLAYAYTPNPVTPGAGCSDGGTKTQDGMASAPQVAQDVIDLYAVIASEPAEVRVQFGSKTATFAATRQGVNYFEVPLGGYRGPVQYAMVRAGKTVVGGTDPKGVSSDCSGFGGKINYNAVTGVFRKT